MPGTQPVLRNVHWINVWMNTWINAWVKRKGGKEHRILSISFLILAAWLQGGIITSYYSYSSLVTQKSQRMLYCVKEKKKVLQGIYASRQHAPLASQGTFNLQLSEVMCLRRLFSNTVFQFCLVDLCGIRRKMKMNHISKLLFILSSILFTKSVCFLLLTQTIFVIIVLEDKLRIRKFY